MSTSPANAFVALGADLGDRAANLQMRGRESWCDRWSGGSGGFVVSGKPGGWWACGFACISQCGGAHFAHNAGAARIALRRLLEIEKNLGRQRGKWGPRVIDLDLLIVEDQVVCSEDLIVPHPRLHERYFVLKPLAEIAPGLVVPGMDQTVDFEALNGQS